METINITWLFLLTMFCAALISVAGVIEVAIIWARRIKEWRHRRKRDGRIIAQAKGAGVWDKKPLVLGGRALELKAWQEYRIKRQPGETDAELRRRYEVENLDSLAWEDYKIKRKPGETNEELRRRCMAEADNDLANS